MGKYSRKSMLVTLLLLFVAADGARGQWRIVAPNAFPMQTINVAGYHGAIAYRSGRVWIGREIILYSDDSGISWHQVPGPFAGLASNEEILDMSFWNKDTGIIDDYGILYQTYDAGNTWQLVLNPYSSQTIFSVKYDRSPLVIRAEGEGTIHSSNDGGKTWNNSTISKDWGYDLNIGTDEALYVLTQDQTASAIKGSGALAVSHDHGTTWSLMPRGFDPDSYCFSLDSCSQTRIYVANENFLLPGDILSRIYMSTDLGVSWGVPYIAGAFRSPGSIAGSISASRDAVYVPTFEQGILRSTDRGLTWRNIGGPGNAPDSRGILAINDNLVFALDDTGNIWKTLNSGGDSILASISSPFSASPAKLFSADTIACDSLTRTITFTRGGCYPSLDSVSSYSIIGPDSARFKATNLSYDSILVTLHGVKQGMQNAQLILALDNGLSDTVTLAGYVNLQPKALSLSTADVKTDTLGATVAVPITINGLEHPEDVGLVLHYDGSVDYVGSFSPSGVRLDIPGEEWPGRSMLHILGAAPGAIAGYAKFNAWNDSNTAAHATFDSMSVLTAISPCEYGLPEAATSTITAPSGCGTTMLSRWVHLGEQPVFMIQPNPTEGDVSISSSLDLGAVTIAIYDMLGAKRSQWEENMSGTPVTLPLPDADGVYTVVLQAAAGTYNLRVVRHR